MITRLFGKRDRSKLTGEYHRANGCAYFSALLILEAHIFEGPLEETVEADLELVDYAISVLDSMSAASTIMAMKRMNVVASELARRARIVVQEARDVDATDGESALTFKRKNYKYPKQKEAHCYFPSQKLEWSWNNSGVEAWPSMDVSLVSSSSS